MKKLRAAVVGVAHPHLNSLYKTLYNHPDEVEFIGFADVVSDDQTHEERMKNLGPQATEDYESGKLREYEDWHELLDMQPDMVIVTADNRDCADICCAFLEKGITVINEKPLAPSMADARRMAEAARANNAELITNWPIAWFNTFAKAKELADAGAVGKVMRVTYRSPATWGPYHFEKPNDEKARTWWFRHERGGGSILDYACYGAILSTWIFGRRAKRVCAIAKQFTTADYSDVEDFSAMMLDFGDGVGLLEGSWSTFNCGQVPTGPIIYGTEGTIVCDRYTFDVKVYRGAEHGHVEPAEVYTLDRDRQTRFLGRNILDYLKGEAPLNDMLKLDLNLDVVAALDAGIRSVETGAFVDTEAE